MTTNRDIYDFLCELAPLELQMDFDNSGFQIGRIDAPVKKVLLALDVTGAVADEATELGAELIISHHPLIFTPLSSICDETVLRIAENKIAVISMHTNLDIADGGVNDVLLSALGAVLECPLNNENCGRVGSIKNEMSMSEFLPLCKKVLNTNGLRYYDAGRSVHRLAVMGGSGGDDIQAAFEKNCDTYLTADIKYHQFLLAKELGINLIDGDHFCTENLIIPILASKLKAGFPKTDFLVSKCHGQCISFI